ncbi:MAG: aminotransferase class III-fold pyridoxal phosphate-dependent enzyme [Armatimonadota bacterium]
MQITRSIELFSEAQKYIPGGANNPIAAGTPLFIERGEGAHIRDADGNLLIDYADPLILGHAHPLIVDAVQHGAKRGTGFGATEGEIELARMIVQTVPSIEKVRLVDSDTEATMSAVRLARSFTGRNKTVKMESAQDGAGIPPSATADTLTLPYNDIDAVRMLFEAQGKEIACLILEPVAGSMGVVPPTEHYLADMRELTHKWGVLLVFDETITGFRLAIGGAQELYGVTPDLTILGKTIGVRAYGGRAEIMEQLAPTGPVHQVGTLSGSPAMGLETLRILRGENPYPALVAKTEALTDALAESALSCGINLQINQVGSMFTPFFTDVEVRDYATARTSDAVQYAAFFRELLAEGVYLAPSRFEAAFVSTAHTDEDLDRTARAAASAFARMP